MGLRESINQRPRLVTAVTVAVIVLSLITIVIQQRALPSRGPARGAPTYDAPGDTDRPVGDDEPQPGGRRPATRGARVVAAPVTTLGHARTTRPKQHSKTEILA